MREKLRKIELKFMCHENNTVTMAPQDKTDRSKYNNTVKAFENI